MTKILSGVLFSSLLVSSLAFAADLDPSLLRQYYTGNFDFNGKYATKKVGQTAEFHENDRHEKWVTDKMGDIDYRLDWGTEKIENEDITTLTESKISRVGKEKDPRIATQTTTFNGNRLRSSTQCFGLSSGNQKDLQCVTATRRACDRLKVAYDIEANTKDEETGKNSEVVKGNVAATAAKAEQCKSLLGSLSNMATAFTKESSQVGSRRDVVIDGDMARVKAHVDKAMNSSFWNSTNIASQSKDSVSIVNSFTSSISGLRALQAAMSACDDAKGKFDEIDGGPMHKMDLPPLETGKTTKGKGLSF